MINKSVMIVDNGLFVELAPRLAREFAQVYYYMPWKKGFPSGRDSQVGRGIEGVEVIDDFFDKDDETDLFVFPDSFFGPTVDWLRANGRAVWGTGAAEELELERLKMRALQKRLGMAYPDTRSVTGVQALRELCENEKDFWVKVDARYRGDLETFHHQESFITNTLLDDLANRLGPVQEEIVFVIEAGVDGIEVGYDGWIVDGKFPQTTTFGYEVKDLGYVGKVLPYADLSPYVKSTNEKLAPVLADYEMRGFLSTEIRVNEKEKNPYLIDPCLRAGSPPTEGVMEVWKNLGEVIDAGANGELIIPQEIGAYFAEVLLLSDYASDHWMPVAIPAELKDSVKLKYLTKKKNQYYVVPQSTPMPIIGAITAVGGSVKECLEKIKSISEEVKALDLRIPIESFDKAQEQIEQSEKLGIKF